MRKFHTRENRDFVFDEDKDQGHPRWVTLEPQRLCSGYLNPSAVDQVLEQHSLILELVPYMLSVSPLDCETLDYINGI
ncbi:MAG: hypothetical protein NTW75_04845 [Planctomycetales bacterium]|jgi:hypothetical protein|nr:hypothetical protein [Planctomycetales bacterium]